MKKILFTALIVFAGTAGYAQKIDVEKGSGLITVDGRSYAKLIKENAPGQLGVNKNFTITNLAGDELLYFVFTQEPERNRMGYETGKILTYYTLNFLNSGGTGRRNGTMRAGGAAKLVAKNKLIVDGQIDPAAEKKFLLKYRNR